MGKAIEQIALERGHTIVSVVNSELQIEQADLSTADVAIEFTQPELAVNHIEWCAKHQIPVVVGTTAWHHQLESVTSCIEENKSALIHASNFSIGVNIFFEVNKKLAQLMSGQTAYSVSIEETHHLQKLDAPSGTAITLANGILENHSDYISWVLGEEKAPHTAEGQLGVTSFRRPDVPGTHAVHYNSIVDSIKIEHIAHNRNGFALGAVIAAEWIAQKKGIYTMSDVLNF